MEQSEFSKLVERYRRYDNRALVVKLAESYGRRDNAFALVGRIRRVIADLGLSLDFEHYTISLETIRVYFGMKLSLELIIKFSLDTYEYENQRIQALRNVMESRNFHMECYSGCDFPVPDNWDLLEKTNPQYPPIDIEGVTK